MKNLKNLVQLLFSLISPTGKRLWKIGNNFRTMVCYVLRATRNSKHIVNKELDNHVFRVHRLRNTCTNWSWSFVSHCSYILYLVGWFPSVNLCYLHIRTGPYIKDVRPTPPPRGGVWKKQTKPGRKGGGGGPEISDVRKRRKNKLYNCCF